MIATTTRTTPQPEWFASWFDSPHYHRLYAHRSDDEAARFVDRLIGWLQPVDGAAVLDLGCGAGRHSRQLAHRRLDVTGVDLSAASIARAKQDEAPNLRFRRQDMRTPFGAGAFDYVFSLFTSFGYFDDPAEDMTVLFNVATSLKSGGTFVLDYLNVLHSAVHLTPEETFEREGVVYRLTRWTDTYHFFKRIAIEERVGRKPLEFVERVAKLSIADFRFMFALCDLRIEAAFGDYDLAPFDVTSSPRLLLVARKIDGEARAGAIGATASCECG